MPCISVLRLDLGSHQPPFRLSRKRTHSPSSKDEQSIGLKDSLLAHSSDPVEMRQLNYQTPGRVAAPACPPRPGLPVSAEGPWPHPGPHFLFLPSALLPVPIHFDEVSEEPLYQELDKRPRAREPLGVGGQLLIPNLVFGQALQIWARDPHRATSQPRGGQPLHPRSGPCTREVC